IVVIGSGYDPTANVGGRGVPIPADLPQGTYVVFGDFAAQWQPSSGAASGSRSVGAQVWALAEGVLEQVPPQYQGTIRAQWVDIADDGTFRAPLTLADAPASPEGGSYGVYTYAAGGMKNAAQEQSVKLNYSTETAADIETAVSVDGNDLIVSVNGAGFGDATGVYAAVIEEGTESQVTAGGGFLAMEYVRGIADGAFQVDLTVAADDLDASKSYEVLVWQQHTLPDAETILARAGFEVPGSVFGEQVVTEVKSATAAGGLTVNVAGSRFGSASGVYAAMIESGTEGDLTADGGFLAMEYVRGITGGAFTVDLTAAAADLD